MGVSPFTPNKGRWWRYVHLTRADLRRIDGLMRERLPAGGRILIHTEHAVMDQVEDLDELGVPSLANLRMVRHAPGQADVRFKVGRLGADVEADEPVDHVAQSVTLKIEAVLGDRYEKLPWHLGVWAGLVLVAAWVTATGVNESRDVTSMVGKTAVFVGTVVLFALLTVWPFVALAPHQIRLGPPLSWYEQRAIWAIGVAVPVAALVSVGLIWLAS